MEWPGHQAPASLQARTNGAANDSIATKGLIVKDRRQVSKSCSNLSRHRQMLNGLVRPIHCSAKAVRDTVTRSDVE